MSPSESPSPTVWASPSWSWKPQRATAAPSGSRRGEFVVVGRVTQVIIKTGFLRLSKKHCHSCFCSQCEGDVIVMSEASMKTNIWWWWWWCLMMVSWRSRYNDWWGVRKKILINRITRKRFQMRSGYRQRWVPRQRSKLQRQVNRWKQESGKHDRVNSSNILIYWILK